MEVAAADTNFAEIFGEVFGHAFGERGDQDALVALGANANFFEQIVDLAFDGADFSCGIDQASGTNDLFDDDAAGFGEFVGTGRGGDIDDLIGAVFEFFESERAVVERGGHAEAVVDEGLFAGAVAVIHGAHLRNGLVRFVDEEEVVGGDVVEKCGRSFAGQTAGEMARIILDSVAIADGAHHFDVEESALLDALRFDDASFALELGLPPFEFFEDGLNGAFFLFGG